MTNKSSSINRIIALVIKELLTLFRDPKGRMVLISPPLIQLLIFSFAVTLEVKHASIMILNHDYGKHGHEIIQRFRGSPTFDQILFAQHTDDFTRAIETEEIIAAIHIPADFSRKLEAGTNTSLHVKLDGRRIAAPTVNSYISQIIEQYNAEINPSNVTKFELVSVNWFNNNLIYRWFTVPSLVAILGMLISLMITSLSVAREKELGTFDQLLVSPLTPYEILIGKTIPAILVGTGESLIIFVIAILVFGIPFTGSFFALVFSMIFFIMSIVGIGLFISSIVQTQQQAILGAFIFMVPAHTLSGYAAPIDNMPKWLQYVAKFNPLEYYLITIKGLFLKSMTFADVWSNTWPLLIIGCTTLSFAGWFFKRRVE